MQTLVKYWSYTTGLSKVDLAQESGLWNVYFDAKGTARTRTLDRYLKVNLLPKNPRWSSVLQTAYFVLRRCPPKSPETLQRLRAALKQVEEGLRNS